MSELVGDDGVEIAAGLTFFNMPGIAVYRMDPAKFKPTMRKYRMDFGIVEFGDFYLLQEAVKP